MSLVKMESNNPGTNICSLYQAEDDDDSVWKDDISMYKMIV